MKIRKRLVNTRALDPCICPSYPPSPPIGVPMWREYPGGLDGSCTAQAKRNKKIRAYMQRKFGGTPEQFNWRFPSIEIMRSFFTSDRIE